MLRERGALATNLEAFAVGFSQFGFMAVLPLLVQTPERLGFGFGASVTASGLFMVPGTIAMLFFAPLGGLLGNKRGSRTSLAVGAVLVAVALAWLAAAHSARWEIYATNALFGAGLGIALAAIAHLVVESVDPTRTGIAAGMNAIARTIGGALGTQVAATIVAADTVGGVPAESGYTTTFVVCAGVAAVAALTAVAVPRRRASAPVIQPALAEARRA